MTAVIEARLSDDMPAGVEARRTAAGVLGVIRHRPLIR